MPLARQECASRSPTTCSSCGKSQSTSVRSGMGPSAGKKIGENTYITTYVGPNAHAKPIFTFVVRKQRRGVAGQGPRVVCERFLENKVHAAQSAAGCEAPLRPAGGLVGRYKPPKRGSGQRPEKF